MPFMWTRLLRKESATAAGGHRYKRRATTTAPRDLQDRVQEHTSSRSFDRVQEGGALAFCSPQGRCHVPHVVRGGAGGPSTRWWEGWAPQRKPHSCLHC